MKKPRSDPRLFCVANCTMDRSPGKGMIFHHSFIVFAEGFFDE